MSSIERRIEQAEEALGMLDEPIAIHVVDYRDGESEHFRPDGSRRPPGELPPGHPPRPLRPEERRGNIIIRYIPCEAVQSRPESEVGHEH